MYRIDMIKQSKITCMIEAKNRICVLKGQKSRLIKKKLIFVANIVVNLSSWNCWNSTERGKKLENILEYDRVFSYFS